MNPDDVTTMNVDKLYPDLLKEAQATIERFWNNYTRLGGSDIKWFAENIGPLALLPSNSRGHVTYEHKDKKGNWVKG